MKFKNNKAKLNEDIQNEVSTNDKSNGNMHSQKNKTLIMAASIFAGLIILVFIFGGMLGLINFGSKTMQNEVLYVETEEEIIIYGNGSEILSISHNGDIRFELSADGEFAIIHDKSDEETYRLRIFGIKSGKEYLISENAMNYKAYYNAGTLLYFEEDGDDYQMMVGSLKEQEEVEENVVYYDLSSNGKLAAYEFEDDVYLYDGKDTDRILKDGFLEMVTDEGVFMVDEDNTLLYFSNGKEYEIADDYFDMIVIDKKSSEIAVLKEYDTDKDEAVMMYFKDPTKDGVEISDEVSEIAEYMGRVFVFVEDDLLFWKISKEDDFIEVVKDFDEMTAVVPYEDYMYWQDETDLYMIELGNDDEIELNDEEEVLDFAMNKGVVSFINAENELFFVNEDEIVEIEDEVKVFSAVDKYVVWIDFENNLFLGDSRGKDNEKIKSNIVEYFLFDTFIYALEDDGDLYGMAYDGSLEKLNRDVAYCSIITSDN